MSQTDGKVKSRMEWSNIGRNISKDGVAMADNDDDEDVPDLPVLHRCWLQRVPAGP